MPSSPPGAQPCQGGKPAASRAATEPRTRHHHPSHQRPRQRRPLALVPGALCTPPPPLPPPASAVALMYQDDLITSAPAPAARSGSGRSSSRTPVKTRSSSSKPSWARRPFLSSNASASASIDTDDTLQPATDDQPSDSANYKPQASQASNISYPPSCSRSSDASDTRDPKYPSLDLAKPEVEVEQDLSFGNLPLGPISHSRSNHGPTAPARRWGMDRGLRICCFIFWSVSLAPIPYCLIQ